MDWRFAQNALAISSLISLIGFVLAALRESLFWAKIDDGALKLYTPGDYTTQAIAMLPFVSGIAIGVFIIQAALHITRRPAQQGSSTSNNGIRTDPSIIGNIVLTSRFPIINQIFYILYFILSIIMRNMRVAMIYILKRIFWIALSFSIAAFLFILFVFLVNSEKGPNWGHILFGSFVYYWVIFGLLFIIDALFGIFYIFGVRAPFGFTRASYVLTFILTTLVGLFWINNEARSNIPLNSLRKAFVTTERCVFPQAGNIELSSVCTIRVLERFVIFFDTSSRQIVARSHDGSYNILLDTPNKVKVCPVAVEPLKTFMLSITEWVPYIGDKYSNIVANASRKRICWTAYRENSIDDV